MADKRAPAADAVPSFIDALDHPPRQQILALRPMLEAGTGISEEIPWNAPGFLTSGHFVTMHRRVRDAPQLVLPPRSWQSHARPLPIRLGC